MDASDIQRRINRQDCGAPLNQAQFIEAIAEKLILSAYYSEDDEWFFYNEIKYLDIIRLRFGMKSYAIGSVSHSYGKVCIEFSVRIEEAMQLIEHQVA